MSEKPKVAEGSPTDLTVLVAAAHKRIEQLTSGATFLRRAAGNVNQLIGMIQAELKAGKLVVPKTPEEFAQALIQRVQLAHATVATMATSAQTEILRTQGRIQGLDMAMGVAEKRAEKGPEATGAPDAPAGPPVDGEGARVIPMTRPAGDAVGAGDEPPVPEV